MHSERQRGIACSLACHVQAANHVGERQRDPFFRIRVVPKLVKALSVEHRFSVANSAWTNGTVERMMRKGVHGAKATLSEWVVVLPAVQWALENAWWKRLQTAPCHVMMGREPRSAFTALIERDDEGFQLAQSTKPGCNSR